MKIVRNILLSIPTSQNKRTLKDNERHMPIIILIQIDDGWLILAGECPPVYYPLPEVDAMLTNR